MPIRKINNYTYKGTLDKIPQEEWVFSFTDKKGIIFNTNSRLKHNTYIGLISVMLLITSIILKRKFNKKYCKYIRFTIYLLMLIIISNLKLSYGFMFFIAIFIIYNPLFYIALIIIGILTINKIRKNKSKEEI